MPTSADLQKLSDATLALYSPDIAPANFVERAFRFLTAITAADQINYGYLDPRAGTMDVATNCLTPGWHTAVQAFGAFMRKYPYFCFDPAVNEGEPFFRSDFITARQFRDLDIFQECFRVLGMVHHAAVHVPTDDGRLLWFGVERARGGGFTERVRTLLSLGRQHLANARKLAFTRHQFRDTTKLDPSAFIRAGFTSRESEVIHWLTEGKTNVEIALLLGLRLQTVKGHLTALFNKTGIGNRLALTLHLLELGRTLAASAAPPCQVAVRAWMKPVALAE